MAIDEVPTKNEYAEWVLARGEHYRNDRTEQLLEGHKIEEFIPGDLNTKTIMNSTWRLAVNFVARMKGLETTIQAMERIPPGGKGHPAQFIPIRFVFSNKVSKYEKLLLAFDSLVVSGMFGRKVNIGKIIHGDSGKSQRIKLAPLIGEALKLNEKIADLLSSDSPPDLVLIRHCVECGFQMRCRDQAIEKDDLSLLGRMSEKERKKLNGKGIFTINQLSYTFRPRRRPKRLREKKEKYHHSLRALAIRENKTHIVGSPEFNIEGTSVYLDVEGLPDRDFYYLIGVRIADKESVINYSFWADNISEENLIWHQFCDLLAGASHPTLIHYGAYEKTFLKRMQERYGSVEKSHPDIVSVLDLAINVVSVIYAQIYFPTYSSGLKDIARHIGFNWTDPNASGLSSVVWRVQWELSKSNDAKQRLINYNIDDCTALAAVVEHLCLLISRNDVPYGVVRTEDLHKYRRGIFKLNDFKIPEFNDINRAAYWDYQRERILVKSPKLKLTVVKRKKRKKSTYPPANKVIALSAPLACISCGRETLYRHQTGKKTVIDIRFGSTGIKRWATNYHFYYYRCPACGMVFRNPEDNWIGAKYGAWLRAFCVYQNIDLRISQGRVASFVSQVLSIPLTRAQVSRFKSDTAKKYQTTYDALKDSIVSGSLVHADETQVNIGGIVGYVWVFTNLKEVVYIYSPSRDGALVHQLLKDFTGVLVTDFYAAYDGLNCCYQKCLIHLIRDLNEDLSSEPFNEEFKCLVTEFALLLRPMITTIDRFGLKTRFLRKHKNEVKRFFKYLEKSQFISETARKCKQRLERNRESLFTFLDYDNVPWNNNNAEHAVKAFALLRKEFVGLSNENGIKEYLILLSICETCRINKINFLDFLRSGFTDITRM